MLVRGSNISMLPRCSLPSWPPTAYTLPEEKQGQHPTEETLQPSAIDDKRKTFENMYDSDATSRNNTASIHLSTCHPKSAFVFLSVCPFEDKELFLENLAGESIPTHPSLKVASMEPLIVCSVFDSLHVDFHLSSSFLSPCITSYRYDSNVPSSAVHLRSKEPAVLADGVTLDAAERVPGTASPADTEQHAWREGGVSGKDQSENRRHARQQQFLSHGHKIIPGLGPYRPCAFWAWCGPSTQSRAPPCC